jgi:molybdate transport system substrate-binding protein
VISRVWFGATVVIATALTSPHAAAARASEVTLLGAIGMRQVMFDLGPKFERATGHTMSMTFDSTGILAKRVASGEQVDVLLVNESALGALVKGGRVVAGSVKPIAASVAAVAVRAGAPKPDIGSPDSFKRMLLSAGSIARPSSAVGGSSGDHIVKVLEQLGITEQVDAKSIIATIGAAGELESPGELVAKGKADVALHQLQELMAVPGLQIVGPFPGVLHGNFTFAAAVGTNARDASAARALIEFLQTAEAKAVIRAKGMEP